MAGRKRCRRRLAASCTAIGEMDLLFRLKQELQAYHFWQTLTAECDQELAKLLRALADRSLGENRQEPTQEEAQDSAI